MSRCVILKASNHFDLECEINEFIRDIKVVSISMTIREYKSCSDDYYACIIYEE